MYTFTKKKIEEFEKVMDKGFIDYFGSQTGGFVPKHYKERFKSFFELALTEQKEMLRKEVEEIKNICLYDDGVEMSPGYGVVEDFRDKVLKIFE
mgnify:CR=1 FL=1